MKKLIIIPIILLITGAHAQLLNFGVKAGVNVSNFVGGDFADFEANSLVGYHVGGLIHIRISRFVIQPELLYSTQGAKLSKGGQDSTYKISYINIPVALQFEFKGGFYLELGPQGGFKTSEEIPDSSNIREFAKSTDLSLLGGIGFHSPKGWGIGTRYTVSVTSVGDFESANFDPDFGNGVFQVALFYTFFNKKNKDKK